MRLYITLIISAFYGCTTSEIQTASFAVGIGDKLLSTPEAEISPPLFAISPEPFSSAHVAVADDGQYLIAYQDRRGDDSGWRAGDNVRVARMAKNGRLLDRGGIEIAFSGPSRQQVFVASDGVDYLVAWVRTTDYEESKIVFARLGHDGRVLQGPTDVRAVKNVEHIAPQVCFDGHDYAMVFGALDNAAWRGSVHAARISKQGRVLSVSELPTTAGKEGARVAIACRKGSLIAWSESDLDSTVLRMLAWPQQQPLPKTSNALSLSSVRQTGWIGLAAGASNFLAVWDEAYTKGGKWSLVGQVVTPAAKRTTPTNRQLSGGQPTRHHPELQYDSKAYRLLMQRLVNNQEQVFAASLDETGVVIEPAKQLTDGDRTTHAGSRVTMAPAWRLGRPVRSCGISQQRLASTKKTCRSTSQPCCSRRRATIKRSFASPRVGSSCSMPGRERSAETTSRSSRVAKTLPASGWTAPLSRCASTTKVSVGRSTQPRYLAVGSHWS